jgi:hypothetical protein
MQTALVMPGGTPCALVPIAGLLLRGRRPAVVTGASGRKNKMAALQLLLSLGGDPEAIDVAPLGRHCGRKLMIRAITSQIVCSLPQKLRIPAGCDPPVGSWKYASSLCSLPQKDSPTVSVGESFWGRELDPWPQRERREVDPNLQDQDSFLSLTLFARHPHWL